MSIVTPAVLPASRKELEEKLAILTSLPSVDRVQIDVVDGRFASPASWPYTAPEELRDMRARGEMLPELHRITYEIDLMCLDAEREAEVWLALGATRLIFHAESIIDLPRFLASIRKRYGSDVISLGLALNIASDLALIEPSLDQIDFVQLMGIARIGRQGQPFDRRVVQKIRMLHARHPHIALQVDGGVSLDNAKELLAQGVSQLVVGSSLLRAVDPRAELMKFEMLQSPYGV